MQLWVKQKTERKKEEDRNRMTYRTKTRKFKHKKREERKVELKEKAKKINSLKTSTDIFKFRIGKGARLKRNPPQMTERVSG